MVIYNTLPIFQGVDRLTAATDIYILPSEPAADNQRGATDSGGDAYGVHRTIDGAGSAFHTAVAIHYHGFSLLQPKYLMRTDRGAQRTAHTDFLVNFDRGNVFQISQ